MHSSRNDAPDGANPNGPDSDFPNIGKVARRELAAHGYTRLDQLPAVTARELLAIHGVGPKAIRILTEALAARGQAFAE